MGKGRAPCCDKSKVKRGPWSPAEDLKLITFIQKNGHDNWRALPKQSGLLRCGKSCRLRWINYLRPDVKRGNFTKEEEDMIVKLHGTLGNKWSKIAAHFPGRTDNEIKNVWNTHLKKRILKIADPRGDDLKESSIVTSSSSSSLSTSSILSSRKRDKVVLIEEESELKKARNSNQEDDYDHDNDNNNNNDTKKEEEQEEISNCIYSGGMEESTKEPVTISTTTSPDSSISNLGDHEEPMLMDTLLFDFEGSYDISDVLEEVNQSENVIDSLDRPPVLDNESDFWDMFGSGNSDSILSESNNFQVQNSVVVSEENVHKIEHNKEWFKYLETELGLLESTTIESNNQELDPGSTIIEEVLNQDCDFFDLDQAKSELDPCLEFCSTYELWPSNLAPNSSAF